MFCDLLLKIGINYGCIEPPYECKLLQRYAIPLSSVRNNKLLVYQNGHIFFYFFAIAFNKANRLFFSQLCLLKKKN